MSKKNQQKKQPTIEHDSHTDINIMPDGMLDPISRTDMAILAVAINAPKLSDEKTEEEDKNR